MKLEAEEIKFWDERIDRSNDLELIRSFYTKLKKPGRLKKIFKDKLKDQARYGIRLQEAFERGTFKPEISDEEIKEIASKSLKRDLKRKNYAEVLGKLDYPVFETTLSETELEKIVNQVLEHGGQGYEPGKDPRGFVDGLIEFPVMHECPEEVRFTFAVLKEYEKYAKPELAKNIVTLKIFHEIILGNFENAKKIKDKYAKHYSEEMAQEFVWQFMCYNIIKNNLEHLVYGARSDFGNLFRSFSEEINEEEREMGKRKVDEDERKELKKSLSYGKEKLGLVLKIADYIDGKEVTPSEEMDKAVRKFRTELKDQYLERRGLAKSKPENEKLVKRLNEAFSEAEEFGGILVGINRLNSLLNDESYVRSVGKEKISEILQARVERALRKKGSLESGANAVYSLAYGPRMFSTKIPGVEKFTEYVSIDRKKILEKMVEGSTWKVDELVDPKRDLETFSNGLRFCGGGEIENAYELYREMEANNEELPNKEVIATLVLNKFVKGLMGITHIGDGRDKVIDEAVGVYEDARNKEGIGQVFEKHVKYLVNKSIKDGFEEKDLGGGMSCGAHDLMGHHFVGSLYTLVSSSLGEFVKDDNRFAPYLKLKEFLSS